MELHSELQGSSRRVQSFRWPVDTWVRTTLLGLTTS